MKLIIIHYTLCIMHEMSKGQRKTNHCNSHKDTPFSAFNISKSKA